MKYHKQIQVLKFINPRTLTLDSYNFLNYSYLSIEKNDIALILKLKHTFVVQI